MHHALQVLKNRQRRFMLLGAGLLLLILATLATDFLFAQWQSTSFYISESLLFSSYWLLFFPLLHVQQIFANRSTKLPVILMTIPSATVAHLIAYPALIWLASKCFLDHTFAYGQTFNFGVTSYLIITLIVYSVPFLTLVLAKKYLVAAPIIVGHRSSGEPELCREL